jgi:hypothetical protein
MSVSSQNNKISYVANGVTTYFAFPYLFYLNAEIQVYLVDQTTGLAALQTQGSAYTVSGVGTTSGGVTFISAPATGNNVIIVRLVAFTQLLNLVNNDPFQAGSINQAMDELEMQIQQLAYITGSGASGTGLALCFPFFDPPGLNNVLPNNISRANKLLAFDTYGNAVTVSSNLNSLTWGVYTSSVPISSGYGYIFNSSSPISISLPNTGIVGQEFSIYNLGTGLLTITQGSSQKINAGGYNSTYGSSGNAQFPVSGYGARFLFTGPNTVSAINGVGQIILN